ncbi:MAG: carbamoyltransferase N-terminal domain-containing protein [Myxococcota bacterium]
MTAVLGLSAVFHDAAAALVVDGQVVAAAQEERWSRQKSDPRLPLEAARFCVERAGLTLDDVDWLVFHEKPLRKFERLVSTSLETFPRGLSQFVQSMGVWLGQRLWVKSHLAKAFDVDPDKVLFSDHHRSHAASAFFSSPFGEAAILTADGVGEHTTAGIYRGVTDQAGSRIELVKELRFPHSMGLFYSALTAYLGFEVNDGECKVMGLASYGDPARFLPALERICHIRHDGSLALDMRYFTYHRHPEKSFSRHLETLLGPARPAGAPLDPRAGDGVRLADIAAAVQALCERWVMNAAREACRVTGLSDLCMAGGVALNSVANGKLLRDGACARLFVQPAAGDAGGALGAAQLASHVALGLPRAPPMTSAMLGSEESPEEVRAFLDDCRIRHETFASDAERDRAVARRLAAGEVGGLFQGRMEWGPRALGARSIIADPRPAGTSQRVNRKIKFREQFRPFAPAALPSELERWFERPARDDLLAPFMLGVVPVSDAGKATLGAVTHVDGTARVQRVEPADNPRFAGLLEAFRAETGLGVLLNTSLNLKGEPICRTAAEAYGVFDRSDLDFLVLERSLVTRSPA